MTVHLNGVRMFHQVGIMVELIRGGCVLRREKRLEWRRLVGCSLEVTNEVWDYHEDRWSLGLAFTIFEGIGDPAVV